MRDATKKTGLKKSTTERRDQLEQIEVVLAKHDQKIKGLEKEIAVLREVQAEIRTMNNALVTLATELKHINEHLRRNESKLDNIENAPRARAQAITTAVIAALAGGLISALIGILFA